MKYGSVCSGVEAATMAWHHMGWEPSFFSEIEPFPCALLQHHYPEVALHGDFTTIGENDYEPIDLLVGGTPCQSFSIAGLRKGMADDRGNLALEFLKLAQRTRPTWVVWENVPGVLSSNGGRDFGAFLGGLGEIGYGFAYRVLNAQYFGVPQRRRRVFVVGYLGNWRPPAAVLFERDSLQGHPAPSREEGEEVAKCLTTGVAQRSDLETETMIPFCADVSPGVTASGPPFSRPGNERIECEALVAIGMQVRRLTPVECERLQGFPDDFTKIPYRNKPADKCPDGPRYKAMGNSMAVPVMKWIGERIQSVQNIDGAV